MKTGQPGQYAFGFDAVVPAGCRASLVSDDDDGDLLAGADRIVHDVGAAPEPEAHARLGEVDHAVFLFVRPPELL